MKKFFIVAAALLLTTSLFAQTDDELFGDDALFGDDTVEEVDVTPAEKTSSEKSSTDLAHGILFQSGAVKVGGTFDTSLTTYTIAYQEDEEGAEEKTFVDHLKETQLVPTANAQITIDARPSQSLRMYTKFGMEYPFDVKAYTQTGTTTGTTTDTTTVINPDDTATSTSTSDSTSKSSSITTILNSFYVKELFTDFSIKDRAFFRFGKHTVTWGAGYFFSPVSDIINTSSINPQDTDAQVNGSLNLRTQITFPGTQNCIWAYLIPDTTLNTSTYMYDAIKTAAAIKGDFVLGGWELGAGAFYKYHSAPKAMLTATGSIINNKVSVFAEGVYSYGSKAEWSADTAWKDKTNIFQATVGASYYWKTPEITFAAQYYYDGNSDDNYATTKGSNVAGTISFSRIGTSPLTANILGLFYLDKDSVASTNMLYEYSKGIVSASLSYSPIDELTVSAGPYIGWKDFDSDSVVAIKLSATLGGGKF